MGWIIDKVATLYVLVIAARWAIEFLVPQYVNTGWFLKIQDFTEPLLKPLRNMLPKPGNFDLSYIVAMVAVKASSSILTALL